MQLALSPDGKHLAVATDRIRIVDLARSVTRGELAGRDLALFDNAVWVVDADALVIRRYTLGLRETTHAILPAGGSLVRAAYGGASALWHGPAPVQLREDRGAIVVEPIAIDLGGDVVTPLTAHRFVRARGNEVALVDRLGTRWCFDAGGGTRVTTAAPLLDGRLVAAMVRRAHDQQLVVLDARDGRVQHRLALHGVNLARFAAMRGLGVLRTDDGPLVVVDLRFGKVLRQYDPDRPVDDLAISDDGQRVVLAYAGGEVVDIALAELIAGRVAATAPSPEPAPVPVSEPSSPPLAPAIASESKAALVVPALAALHPRRFEPVEPARLDAWLDGRRELAAAVASHAIATGWDSGAIGFVDEARPPFEKEVAAVVLGVRGLANLQLRKTEEAVATARARVRELEAGETPLSRLAGERGLDELERELLVLLAAPVLWGELARLYGILANDDRRALCDEQLLVQLCGTRDRHAIARALDRDRPLVRCGLVHVSEPADRPRPFAALAVDPLVLRLLRDQPLDADVDRGVTLAPPAPPLADLIVPRARLERALAALAGDHAAIRLVVRGRIGSGRRTVVTALADRAGRRVGVVDAGPHLRERRLDRLAVVLRRTWLRGWLPLVDNLELASDDQRGDLLAMLREHAAPLAIRLPGDATLRIPDAVELDLPALTLGECAEHWSAGLAAAGIAVDDIDTLAARFHVGPGMIDRCLAAMAGSRDVERAMRSQLASRLGEVATRVERLPTWAQVVLPDDIEDSVLELIARIRYRRTVFDTWGFDEVVTTARGVTALFQGPPGTGKTLVAGAIANELGLDLYRIDVSRIMSKWIGETEQNLAKVFAAAEDSQAILLFDEADSLFGKRTEVKSSNDRYANTEVNYLLQRLDSFEGIAILTTNFGSAIDNAFKRRLSFRLTFPFPDDDTREQLWKAHLPPRLPRSGTIDLAALARRFRMSGGYIRNAALRAAFLAAEERSMLTQDHLERAIRAEFREIGNLADSGVLA